MNKDIKVLLFGCFLQVFFWGLIYCTQFEWFRRLMFGDERKKKVKKETKGETK